MRQKQTLVDRALSPLSAAPLFQGLAQPYLRALEEGSIVADVPSGFEFFRTGEPGQGLFLLERGAVQTFRASGAKKIIIAELKPPDVFGEIGCVGDCRCHCSAISTEPSRVRTISRNTVDLLLRECPILSQRLLELVSRRFLNVLMDLDATSFQQLIPRLAKLLLERADGDFVSDLTHKEIAGHLRVYRESATAALGELKKAGIIEIRRKQIRVLSRPRLERAARE